VNTLILASSSRYRSELLSRLGLGFESRTPDVDETPMPGEAPEKLVRRLSQLKAATVAAGYRSGLIIGSDQVAVCGTQVLGKPGTEERACAQLAMLSGNSVSFLTGLCLRDAASGLEQTAVVQTIVRFRALTEDEITDYVRRERPLDCAGAFKSEGLGIALFEGIDSEDPTALVGLPLIELCRMLTSAGRPVLGASARD
jgi:septum formation protein